VSDVVDARPGRPQPAATQASGPFWDATRERRFLVETCADCGQAIWYPRPFCPHCGGTTLEWHDASGRGQVYTFTVEHKPSGAFGTEPYVVALVELEEGVRLLSNVVEVEPGDGTVGMPVELVWEPLDDGRHLPLFRPAGD
jgi:uncharacterized OB-fold protein